MKSFRFRLARLERLREVARNESRARLAAAVRDFHDAAERAARRARNLERAEGAWSAWAGRSGSNPKGWHERAEDLDATSRALERAREAERAARARVARVEHDYAEASRQHRVLVRLRERAHERWAYDVEREEQKQADEAELLRRMPQRRREDGA